MTNSFNLTQRWSQFSNRGLLLLIVIVAMSCAWYSSLRHADVALQLSYRTQRLQMQHLEYYKGELGRAKSQLSDQLRGKRPDSSRSFWESDLDGMNLMGMTIASSLNAFQRASFRNCNLENATLQGGDSSFQFACFDEANLTGASLFGGPSSFQLATFIGADITDATLTGTAASFHGASFEDATMVGARLSGSFQGASISGARLEGADLSAVDSDDLASCCFDKPPTYDAKTKFPQGFDPVEQFWQSSERRAPK
ncbi:MAG: pentapeptide repeat-containing protein [Pirellulaceae bacterium]|jgi:uncharacterized protein YjbI with pentapeptide repeats|nr:pentapeptide repeat-containing protein [Pirellulaceae bacterium]